MDGQQIVELKRGSKGRKFLPAAISNLNIQTLGYIGDIPDFRYDTKSKKFYTESSICHERTTTELNQAASALRLFEGISFDEILNLCNILYENPYFAAYTNIGKRVYQIIRDWPVSMTFDEPYYYRARIADSENELYLASDMMMPPEGIPSQGRYNEYGRSCFYDKIPSERMNADKCIGFCIEEDGGFVGMYELVVNDKVQRENINSINYFRDDQLVQQAISDMEKLMAARQQSKEQERSSTKKSVLDALRSLKAKKQEQPAQEQDKPKKVKKKGID